MPRFSHHPCPNMLRIPYHSFRTSWKSISQGFVCFRLSKSEALQLCSIPIPLKFASKDFSLAILCLGMPYPGLGMSYAGIYFCSNRKM